MEPNPKENGTSFFKIYFASFFASITTFLILGGILFLIFIFFIVGIVASAFNTQKDTEITSTDEIILLDLSEGILDTIPFDDAQTAMQKALSGEMTSNMSIWQAHQKIEAAALDPQIKGMIIQGAISPQLENIAIVEELRKSLLHFKSFNKFIYAYDSSWGKSEYWLGSVADQIFIHPLGSIDLSGLASVQLFLKDTLDQWGITFQATKNGKYKSAIEMFTRNNISEENKEQISSYLNNIWDQITSDIASSRKMEQKELLEKIKDELFITPQKAKELHLVDDILYPDEFHEKVLKDQNIDENFLEDTTISLASYHKSMESFLEKLQTVKTKVNENHIALVYASGEIVDGDYGLTSGAIVSQPFARMISSLRTDEKVKAVVLRLNSPGGSALAAEVITRELDLLAKKKPLYISMGGMAASGGYWMATSGKKIFADTSTITGSIGVFSMFPHIEKLAGEQKVKQEVIKTHEYADTFSFFRSKTEKEILKIQEYTDQIYARFLDRVAQNRKWEVTQADSVAQGRVWTGKEAQNVGLVDDIKNLPEVIKEIQDTENMMDTVIEYPRLPTGLTEFLNELSQVKIKNEVLEKILKEIEIYTPQIKEELQVQARIPYNIKIK